MLDRLESVIGRPVRSMKGDKEQVCRRINGGGCKGRGDFKARYCKMQMFMHEMQDRGVFLRGRAWLGLQTETIA